MFTVSVIYPSTSQSELGYQALCAANFVEGKESIPRIRYCLHPVVTSLAKCTSRSQSVFVYKFTLGLPWDYLEIPSDEGLGMKEGKDDGPIWGQLWLSGPPDWVGFQTVKSPVM